ncbi:hypothetical protein C3V39_02320 [Prevotella sp. oral taxon 820]|nr:hypothetical protein C3V39_02320 [Prevotella sp. oral taxon 820]
MIQWVSSSTIVVEKRGYAIDAAQSAQSFASRKMLLYVILWRRIFGFVLSLRQNKGRPVGKQGLKHSKKILVLGKWIVFRDA